jgi:hypothetical protein
MRHNLLLTVPLALALVGACSSSPSSGTGAVTDGGSSSGGGSGGGSGSGSGGGSGSGSGGGSSGSSSGANEDGGSRPTETCSQIQSEAVSSGLSFAPGSWGPIPSALQSLPAGATLCGTQSLGDAAIEDNDQVIVASSLTGEALRGFYAPLAAKLSCVQQTAGEQGFLFNCTNGQTFAVVADTAAAYLILSYTD